MKTIIDLFEESVSKFSNNPYLWEKTDSEYKSLTYSECREQVRTFGAGLVALGVEKGDRISLLSEGRNAWVFSELGMLYAGAVNVPLSVKIEESAELRFRIEHSESRFIIVSKTHSKKIRQLRGQLPLVEKVIILDEVDDRAENEIFFTDILSMGNELLKKNPILFEERWKSIMPNDRATICYSSGTTADPKGIVLSHRNYTANVEQACTLMKIEPFYRSLVILPWDHSFAHTAGIYAFMANGASIASVQTGKTPMETLKNIPINIKELKPHVMMSVPALAKNFKKNIESGILAKGEKVKKLFEKALKVAYAYNGDGFKKGKGFQLWNLMMYKVYDKLIFSKIRANFGGNLLFFIGGGAILDIELQKFFYALGIPMLQGYGLSEASPIISANSLFRHKLGTSGYLVKNLDLKIVDEQGNTIPNDQNGEIVVKGENVMLEYWRNPKATHETIKDGWLHTGDMGHLDCDGFIYVLGRFKSLLISNDGEKYSPEGIEEAFIEKSKFIEQCILHNSQNPYTVCLLVPNLNALSSELKKQNLNFETEEGICHALKLIQNEIDQFKPGGIFEGLFPPRWLPAAIAILDQAFTEQNHFLNSTLKVVRGKITDHYKSTIEFLYTPEAKDICNYKNKESIKLLKIKN